MKYNIGDEVRIKKTADVPYRGRRGVVTDITIYPNGRTELEVRISSAAASKFGKPHRYYKEDEIEKVA